MSGLASLVDFAARIAAIRDEAGVPGLSFAVWHGGKMISAAAGVLSLDTGIAVRPDSLFQIGSITKSLTATLVMQAAEEGLVDIDRPVRDYIGVRVGRGPYTDSFTARQLMAHTSGLDGDLFLDTGRDDDAIAKYMVLCSRLEFLVAPGRFYNYSNAGYAVLGRLLEVVRGKVYDRILDEHLFARIGATRSTTMPEVAAFRRTASGHGPGADGATAVVPLVHLPRALGPAGLSLYSTAEDLIAYACAHMSGESLVSRAGAAAMRTPQVALPEGASWGLGWKIIANGNTTFVGHDGGTIGQVASLWTAPEANLAVAMCANGGRVRKAWEAVAFPIFREVCGATPETAMPDFAPVPDDLERYEGVYENSGVDMEVTATSNGLDVVARQKFLSLPEVRFAMRPLGGDRFRATIGDDDKVVTAFLDPDAKGRPTLFFAGRIHRRKGG
ncbi:MAG: serine hydrolase [Proteobacteria bacterium]|nr:serine hydrolase [Pseudomonadota bacterium]